MAIPVWAVGQVLAAADVNNWFVPLAAFKPSDTSKTSNTTLANDPDLLLPVAANALYVVHMYLDYEGGTQGSSDLKTGWVVPASATLRFQWTGIGSGGGSLINNTYAAGSNPALGTQTAGVLCGATVNGTLDTAGTAGNLQFQWAQNTSSGTATIVHAQSYLLAQRVG